MSLPPSGSAAALRADLAAAWLIRPVEPVSVVAARHLYLSPEYTAAPGYVDFDRFPYLRAPTDRLGSDDPCRTVVFLGPIQGGKTVIGQAWLTAIITQTPGPTIWVTDTDTKAEIFSKKRLDLMVRDDPTLRGLVADPKSRNRDNTIKFKTFPGGDIKLVGAQAASGLTSDTIRHAIIDEADDHRANVSYAGSSIDLAMGRQTSYGDLAKTLIVSSPKLRDDSDIESWFLRGTRCHYHVPCPRCGEFQRLVWRDEQTREYRLRWPAGHPDEAVYVCAHCGASLEDREKNAMLPAGQWRPERPDEMSVASYRLNALYLPVGAYSWVDMARQWEAATADLKAGATDKHRTFVNTRLAETYEVPGETLDAHALAARVEPAWPEGALPAGVKVIVIGIDVQDDRVELLVLGVGLGLELWILAYHVILSDPLAAETWESVDDVLRTARTREDSTELPTRATCIDSGHRTQQVYDYARTRSRRGWRVHAIKGVPGKGKPIWDKRVRHGSKNKARQAGIFYAVGVDTAKDTLAAYLRRREPGPGYVHIPDRLVRQMPDLLDQLASEKRTRTRDAKGREVWTWDKLTSSTRNEAWDCLVYALAAVHSLIVSGLRLEAGGAVAPAPRQPSPAATPDAHPDAPPRAPVAAPRPAPLPTPRRRPGGGRDDWSGGGRGPGPRGRDGDWF